MTKIIDKRGKDRLGYGRHVTRNKKNITHIVRHHSGTANGNVEAFERYWSGTLGWKQAGGYHKIILPSGEVELCYDAEIQTNGVRSNNPHTYHICVVGNGSFTDEQEKAFKEVCKEAQEDLDIPNENVWGHNEFDGHRANICPGIDMNKVRGWLEEKDESAKGSQPTEQLYRVRKSWSDASSQLGAFVKLDNAKTIVDDNPSHKVFDWDGRVVYEVKEEKVEVKPEPTPQPKPTKSNTKKYALHVDVRGYVNAADAKAKRNHRTTVRKGEYFVFNESQGMINISTREGSAGSWINPSDNRQTSSTPSQPSRIGSAEVFASALNVRSSGSMSGRILRTLSRSAKVDVYRESNGWYLINANGGEWISANTQFVRFTRGTSTKSIAQMAQEVIDGLHGQGHSNRRQSLGISQAEYDKVRAEVNRRLG